MSTISALEQEIKYIYSFTTINSFQPQFRSDTRPKNPSLVFCALKLGLQTHNY